MEYISEIYLIRIRSYKIFVISAWIEYVCKKPHLVGHVNKVFKIAINVVINVFWMQFYWKDVRAFVAIKYMRLNGKLKNYLLADPSKKNKNYSHNCTIAL